jgi:hypothetical protein
METVITVLFFTIAICIFWFGVRKERKSYRQPLEEIQKRINTQHAIKAADQEDTSDDLESELAWRRDRYKRTFSSGDVVTFYETDKETGEIWKGYLIVQSFAVIIPHRITLIPQITYSYKLKRTLDQKETAQFHPELTPPDRYYDSTKEEARDFMEKLSHNQDNTEKFKKTISNYISGKEDGDDWIEHTKSAEERFE